VNSRLTDSTAKAPDKGEVGGSSPPRPTITKRAYWVLLQKPQPTIQPTHYCIVFVIYNCKANIVGSIGRELCVPSSQHNQLLP
jgi:hypothetical protein